MVDLINHNQYQELLDGPHAEYYVGRWEYYREVIKIISKLNIDRVLELGPGFLPIVNGSDLMLSPEYDHFGRPEDTGQKIIIHDATIKPWPISDKHYG